MDLSAVAAKYPFLQGNISFWETYLEARETVLNMLPGLLDMERIAPGAFNAAGGTPFLTIEALQLTAENFQKLAVAFASHMGIRWDGSSFGERIPNFTELEVIPDGNGFVVAEVHSAIASFLESIVFPEEETPGWRETFCPICGAPAGMGLIDTEGKKTLVCSHCHTIWLYLRTACGLCGHNAERGMVFMSAEELPGWRIELCEACKFYLKVFDLRHTQLDIISYPLFYLTTWELDLTVRERGYEAVLFAIFERAAWLEPKVLQ
jgi:FdhE protein